MMVNAFRKPQRVSVVQFDGTIEGFKEIQGFFGDKVQLMDLYNKKVILVKSVEGNTVAHAHDFIIVEGSNLYAMNKNMFFSEFEIDFEE